MKTSQTYTLLTTLIMMSLLGCTSNLTYTAASPSASALDELALAAKVDGYALQQSVNILVANGGLASLDGVEGPSQFPFLACVADGFPDGVLNGSDVEVFAGHIGKTCPQIAQEAEGDPEIDDDLSCPNLYRDLEHAIDLSDLAVFALLLQEQPEFSTDLCHNSEAGDFDHLSSYMESYAWLNLDPLDAQTYDGIDDYDYYLGLIGGSSSECGNGSFETGEVCDGTDLGVNTCKSLGFDEGFLHCTNVCTLDVRDCTGSASIQVMEIIGDFQDDQVVDITGQGFGTKRHGPPLRWVDFEEGNLNDLLSEPDWGISYDTDTWCKPHYSLENSRDGSKNGMFCGERSSDGYEYQQFYTGHLDPSENRLYFSGYIWFDWGNATGEPGQIKTWRIHSGGGSAFSSTPWVGSENTRYDDGRTGCRVTNREDNCPELSDSEMRMYHSCYTNHAWSSFQVVLDLGDSDTYNGFMKQYINGVDQGGPFSNYQFTCSGDRNMDNIIIGNYFGNTTTSGWENQVHFDDVYIDDTWQRVEVGNAPVYDDCTHREIQVPITWDRDPDNPDRDRISLTVNRGEFDPGETVYLFVVNRNNQASPGFPLTIN